MQQLNLMRKVGFWEGISWVFLITAMIMKYGFGNESLMSVAGNVHGFLFVIFAILTFIVGSKYKWSLSMYVICAIAAIIPFGTFVLDSKFLRPLSEK